MVRVVLLLVGILFLSQPSEVYSQTRDWDSYSSIMSSYRDHYDQCRRNVSSKRNNARIKIWAAKKLPHGDKVDLIDKLGKKACIADAQCVRHKYNVISEINKFLNSDESGLRSHVKTMIIRLQSDADQISNRRC